MADTPDLKELLKMAQEMQQSMKEAHEDLSRQAYRGKDGEDYLEIDMNGKHDTLKAKFNRKILNEFKIPPEMTKTVDDLLSFIEGLIPAANNAANRAIEKASEQKMMQLTKKLGLPGAEREREKE